jgi:hypothetical protein
LPHIHSQQCVTECSFSKKRVALPRKRALSVSFLLSPTAMANNIATPRVNAATIKNYIGTIVRVVGQAQSNTSLRAFDGEVTIRKPTGSSFQTGNYYEVVGEVSQDGSVNENFLYDWGQSFGMFPPPLLLFPPLTSR